MDIFLWVLAILVVAGGFWWWQKESAARRERELSDAAAEARRWYERLGGQVLNLSGDEPAVRQALADASERYNAAGAQLEQARTVYQYQLARETALEGLQYVRAARIALGIDPGPELPPLAAARGAGRLTEERQVEVEGQTIKAGPQPSNDKPYYYPGGRVEGRPVPAGWYSQPVWRPALAGAAGAVGGLLLLNALFPPMYGYGAGYEQGFQDGAAADGGEAAGADAGGEAGGGDFAGGELAGGDFAAGDFGGGDFGGGDFGGFGGDFGGGDFGGFGI
ncbi:MAG TPA: hypothetical protein VIL37_12680 [Natronosporangium sp.]